MLITYRDALEEYGSRYYLRKAVSEKKLKHVSRGFYSTSDTHDSLMMIVMKYPEGIVTGLTAYFMHGLTDTIPDVIDLATKRSGSKFRDSNIKQHFVPADWLNVGKETIVVEGVELPIYNQERMLLELARNRNKMPYDIYKEIVASYRKRADTLDIYKLQDYAEVMPKGAKHLERIMKEVF